MIVRLIGPTGMETRKPASQSGEHAVVVCSRARPIALSGSIGSLGRFFAIVVFFDLAPHLARNARPNEAVDQIRGEHDRHDDVENLAAQE